MVPKLKVFRIYWNLGNSIFRISRSRFWCQILISLNIYHLFVLNWSQKCSEFIEIEHIQYFKYANLEFDVKMVFMKYLPPFRAELVPKWKMLRIYWNLGTFDISKITISILLSKIIFTKYVPLVRPKLIPKLKVLRIYWNWAHSIFQICQSRVWCQKWFLWNIYHLLGPNWSQNEKYSGFIEIWVHLIFRIALSWFCCQKLFSLNTYHLFGPKWS